MTFNLKTKILTWLLNSKLLDSLIQELDPSTPNSAVSTGNSNTVDYAASGATSSNAAPASHFAAVSVPSSEPDRKTLEAIMNFDGELLTRPDGPVPVTIAQAQYAALLIYGNDPVLLVSKSQAKRHEVSTVRSLIRKQNIKWSREYQVGLDVIRSVYARAGVAFDSETDKSGQTVTMERVFVDLITEAAKRGASDIHVYVRGFEAEIFFRINSVLSPFKEMTALEGTELCHAAFAMADTSDPTYTPNEQQGARVNGNTLKSLNFKGDVESLRLQFNPLVGNGRHMVVRLLYSQRIGSEEDLDTLGYSSVQIVQFKKMCKRTSGVNVISGPTGSGKSTTLQRSITTVMRERKGLSTLTIEDPPEYVIDKAAQIPVTNAQSAEERSEKFRSAITGALRSDPDVIMIGEIRDSASAKLVFEAAMTGHAVWTTLHANSAVSIIDRLRDLNVDSYKLWDVSNISGLVAQRLVRRTNQDMSVVMADAADQGFADEELVDTLQTLGGKSANEIRFANAGKDDEQYVNCFSDRTVVAEVIIPDQFFLDQMRLGEKSKAISHWQANLGGLTILEHGFLRVLRGEIDPREIEGNVGFFTDLDVERAKWIQSHMDEL